MKSNCQAVSLWAPLLMAMCLLLVAWLSLPLTTYPRYLDDVLYISTAWEHEAYPHILNRYVTVYLLDFVNYISGFDNPLKSSQLLGAFLFLSIILFTYLNGRLLCAKRSHLAGILAVIGILSTRGFIIEYGEVLADYTVTVIILIGVFVFLRVRRNTEERIFLRILFVFGAIAFAAIRAKETGGILVVLVVPLLAQFALGSRWPALFLGFSAVFTGAILMVLVFGFVNWYTIGEPLFGLRLQDFEALLSFNTRQRPILQMVGNDYWTMMTATPFFIPALMSLWDKERSSGQILWIWIMIACLILFLDATLINGGWHLVTRYFTPAFALLSAVAGSMLSSRILTLGVSNSRIIGIFLLVVIISQLAFLVIWKPKGIGADFFANGILIPTLAPLLVFTLPGSKKSKKLSMASLIIYLFMVLPSAFSQSDLVLRGKIKTETLFNSFAPFRQALTCKNNRFFFSRGIAQEKGIPIGEGGVVWEAFDLYMACHTERSAFLVGDFSELQSAVMDSDGVNYVFLTTSELLRLQELRAYRSPIMEGYELAGPDASGIALLVRK